MKALCYEDYGGPLVLMELPEPTCGPDQLRVRPLASSVNPIDHKVHSGAFKLVRPVQRPATPGLDLVGEVLESNAGGFEEGQRIVARIDHPSGGAMAEQCVVGADMSVVLPDSISSVDAAALPLAGMTALQGLRDDCGMLLAGEKKRVLIVGASGGVGHYAVQIAHLAGAHVTAVCGETREELVRSLGAHAIIDYRQQDHFKTDAPYDILLDCAARAPWRTFKEVMATGAHLSQPTPTPIWFLHFASSRFTSRQAHFTMLKANAADLQILIDQMAAGDLRSVVGATFDWTKLEDAWKLNQRGGTEGKIVLTFS